MLADAAAEQPEDGTFAGSDARSLPGVEETRGSGEVRRPNLPLVGESQAIRQVLAQIDQVAPTTATVLFLGETGAGKEVFAQRLHEASSRCRRPMVRMNCAAMPSALVESELFGRERGAYTDAVSRQIGRFEAANGSTILLDEIGELSLEVQVKLLRVLQDHVIERLGSTQPIRLDVRVVAATNRDLPQMIQAKEFREDLYYRLNVFPVTVPPLRDHAEDIPALVRSFVDEFSRSFGRTVESISEQSLLALQQYEWPGNVRELRNVVERAMIVANGPVLSIPAPRPGAASRRCTTTATLAALQSAHIRATLESVNWRIRGAGGAAERLGLKPTTLESRMARLGIVRAVRSDPAPAGDAVAPRAVA